MSKQFKPGRTIVQPSASRIRREPVRQEKEVIRRSEDWEIRIAITGMVLFALAITILSVGFGAVTN